MAAQWSGDFNAAELSAQIQRNDTKRSGYVESYVLVELLVNFDFPVYGAVLRRLLDNCWRNPNLIEYSRVSFIQEGPS